MQRIRILAIAAVMGAAACSSSPVEVEIPAGLTPVTLTTGFRHELWENPPRVTFTAQAGGIRFLVERRWLCAMIANAGERRGVAVIDVYATVSANPAALCVASLSGVSEYEGVVPGQAGTTYRINVYESVGESKASLIGSAIVKPK